jgi:signal transduction histidine kinase
MIVDLSVPASTADELSRRDELAERLRWLVTLRWVALASVGGAVAVSRALSLLVSALPLVAVAGTMLFLNLGFYGIHKRAPVRTYRALSAEALLQIAVDVIGLGLLIFFSGGLMNPFVFYFCFHVVIAAILLEKRQAYAVALLTAGVIILLGMADETRVSSPWSLQGAMASVPLTTLSRLGRVFALTTTLSIAVYMVTEIMDRLRARTQDVRHLNSILNERVDMLASAERKLAAEHQRARAILECMDEGVVVVDLQGQVLLANTAAQQSALLALDDTLKKAGLTHTHTHLENEHCHDHGHADHDCDHRNVPLAEQSAECPMGNPGKCLQEALEKGGKLCAATLALLGADPPKEESCARLLAPKSPTLAEIVMKDRRFENTVSPVRAGGDALGLVIVSRDVTERRSLERQVVHAEKLHALGNLAAGVAHELNTPLGTILGYAQMLLDDPSPKPELKAIEDQARRCRKIVQGLLDFARTPPPNPLTGHQAPTLGRREECSANELAAKINDLIAHSLKMRDIVLELNLCQPPPPLLRVATNEFEQVLVNLVTNAADAIDLLPATDGKERKVTIQTLLRGETVTIAVEDTGPGVPAGLAEQIFEPFFTTKAAGRGTGLGLSIARRIVEDHDGRLVLTRRADGNPGARFEVMLDCAAPGISKTERSDERERAFTRTSQRSFSNEIGS